MIFLLPTKLIKLILTFKFEFKEDIKSTMTNMKSLNYKMKISDLLTFKIMIS